MSKQKNSRRTGSMPAKGAIKLMQTAERLFGERGIDGVSLRQIVSAAGQANSSAVQHHFGTKQGLIQAVYDMRLPDLDDSRQRRLDAAKDSNDYVSVPQLLAAMFMPVAEEFDEVAQKSFAMFSTRLLQFEDSEHPHAHTKVPQPAYNDIVARLAAHFSYLPHEVLVVRMRLASELFFGALSEWRRLAHMADAPYRTPEPFWSEVLQSIEALLRLPYTGATYQPLAKK
ncbi:MAG: helix-turn-helix domain-containing protein [Porticoccaceae bacterium]|jgi:AcrR family transcriptional regulator|nr:helix-turn-helix domain-containing protein [Porticoccaceae bacterium]MEA3298988.1 helix-turn-helix domain-containing protein [Pseudomonadota bacterium]HLS99506.1 helix-turn-helix domain-containing protein [Porticoccaceae bacterium]